MRTPRSVRTSGYVLALCGLFLVVVTGWLANALLPSMSHPGVQVGGTIFSGTAEQARAILSLFGAVGAFGTGAIAYGAWMIVTGRRSVAMMLGVLALALVLAGMCWWTLTKLPA
jgi:hypothetical protein